MFFIHRELLDGGLFTGGNATGGIGEGGEGFEFATTGSKDTTINITDGDFIGGDAIGTGEGEVVLDIVARIL